MIKKMVFMWDGIFIKHIFQSTIWFWMLLLGLQKHEEADGMFWQ